MAGSSSSSSDAQLIEVTITTEGLKCLKVGGEKIQAFHVDIKNGPDHFTPQLWQAIGASAMCLFAELLCFSHLFAAQRVP